MAGPFSTINGAQIVSGTLLVPSAGLWTADVQLAGSTALSGAVALVVGNLTLAGTVYRSETYGGQTRARLVGGAGGWRTVVQAQGYGSSGGIKMSTVLRDVALACGERVNVAADAILGNAWTTVAGDAVASDLLWKLVATGVIPSWYVDTAGVTQLTAWPATTIATPFTVTDQRPDEGLIVVATEDYASWLPGCSFTAPQLDGSYTSAGVHYVWTDDGQFRLEVLTGTAGFLDALAAFVARQVSPTRFYGRYAYTISNPSLKTVDLAPVNAKLGLPTCQNVPLTSDCVSTYTPPNGGVAHVQFLDGDPAQPIVVWTAGTATVVNLLGGSNPVARLGDQVQCFLPIGLPILTTSGPGTITAGGPIAGVVTQGSQQVNSA
jgi:hypothetical protein